MTVRKFLESFFRNRVALSSCQSATGSQLESLRLGMIGSGSEYSKSFTAERRMLQFAVQVKIWGALTPIQQTILFLQNSPVLGSQEYIRTVHNSDLIDLKVPLHDLGGSCNAPTKSGSLCKHSRLSGEARCRTHIKVQSQPATRITRAGEEYISNSDAGEDLAIVRGSKGKFLTNDDIAEMLDMSLFKVRRQISNANEIIENHPLFVFFEET